MNLFIYLTNHVYVCKHNVRKLLFTNLKCLKVEKYIVSAVQPINTIPQVWQSRVIACSAVMHCFIPNYDLSYL